MGGEAGLDEVSRGFAKVAAEGSVREQGAEAGGEGVDVVWRDEEAGLPIVDEGGDFADGGGEDGEGTGHGFEEGDGETFLAGGGDEHIERAVDLRHVFAAAEEGDAMCDAEGDDALLECGTIGAVADDVEACVGKILEDAGGGLEEEIDAFLLRETADEADEERPGGEGSADGGAVAGAAAKGRVSMPLGMRVTRSGATLAARRRA